MSEKLVFESSLESMFVRSTEGRRSPELVSELRKLGVDLDKKMPPALTRDAWYAGIEVLARLAWRPQQRPEALRSMGRQLIENLQHTLLGKTFSPVMRLLGPERLLRRVPFNMKSANNFATATVEVKAPRTVVIDTTDVGQAPELFAGSLEALLFWAGVKTVDVTFTADALPRSVFTVSWTE